MTRRRTLSAAALLAVLATAGGLLWWRASAGTPLETYGARNVYVMVLPKSTTDFTMGEIYLESPGDEISVLEVKPRTSANVEYLGAFSIWPRDALGNNLVTSGGFPARSIDPAIRRPIEQAVPAGETAYASGGERNEPLPVLVSAGFRITEGGMGAVNGIEVVYEVNGKKVRELFNQVVIACIKPLPCEPPNDLPSGDDWEDHVLREFGLLRDES